MISNKDTLIISLLTVITVMAWIAFDVYHAAATSTLTEVDKALIQPLNPDVDKELINQIQLRQLPQ